jgi:hypothetical protein
MTLHPKKVEEGLLRNKAFQEYRALSRAQKDKLKKQAYEQKDLSKVENKDEQIIALQDIVTTQVSLVNEMNRQLDGARVVFKAISAEILEINDKHFIDPQHQATSLAETIKKITKILIDFAGTEQEEMKKEEDDTPDVDIPLD